MILREDLEKREYEQLSSFAAKAAESRGRQVEEEKCDVRTDFQRDRDRIVHSKALRRLMHKTQVFLAPEGDHFRTRLTHTLEVSQIARTISRALGLNEDLTEAIAMGHDLGHTPFGHNGESFLDERHPSGFKHNVQSLRVVEVLEPRGEKRGMNLTLEVRDGILNHTGPGVPFTLEGQVVKISDRIAYINHDIDDAIRGGIIKESDLPKDCLEILGSSHRQRINTMILDLAGQSDGKDHIIMSDEVSFHMNKLRTFMFERVYHSKVVKKDEELDKIRNMIFSLYQYFMEHPNELPEENKGMIEEFGIDEVVKDYIAGMTDRYALNLFTQLFVPKGWK
ncbi:deoxyguanosinetriphosphate triphosphohydrolase [Sinanaerobacter chloroacetimidivorans]|jgi:dGTPase|uniref:Deoxyguanosinetriphosphate triphosphohydrolase-like protein n=1 Tax=Sinanaerobacter chloroacetimidivorans TaxID=2818044 RepID=A0A8J8B012_9FIRM|nr:deoxyguanosinetriphosphate triphosphohydrolase [Sinanaerobacter chloroacetimidivorans]MBR0596739.1 deoxyguanosinetriphosphate triphosphohydrolase [Sinanaerobacter chloroacetimidivorans]